MSGPSLLPTVLEQMESRRSQALLIVARLTLAASALVVLFYVVVARLSPAFPLATLVMVHAAHVITILLALFLRRRRAIGWGAGLFLAGTSVTLFVVSYFVGGPTGPVSLTFGVMVIIAVLIGGRVTALWMAISLMAATVLWSVLEANGILTPAVLSPSVTRLYISGLLALVLVVTIALLAVLMRFAEEALAVARQRDLELAEALRRTQEAAEAERAARQQAAGTLGQLQQSVQEYTTFLGRVGEGDFEARLDMETLAAQVENPALVSLGAALNRTVETLVTALTDLQVVQRRYLREAWTMFLGEEKGQRAFRAQGGDPAAATWFEPMADALTAKRTVVRAGALALPITVRGEIIGALGARRTDAQPWTAEDLAVIEAVMDQLGQTLETLRLVEETQRQAQREQVLGDLSVRFSRSFDVDALLQQAVVDLGRLLDLDEVSVYIEPTVAAAAPTAGAGETV